MSALQNGLYIAACTAVGAGIGAAALMKLEKYTNEVSGLKFALDAHDIKSDTVAELSRGMAVQTTHVTQKIDDFSRALAQRKIACATDRTAMISLVETERARTTQALDDFNQRLERRDAAHTAEKTAVADLFNTVTGQTTNALHEF